MSTMAGALLFLCSGTPPADTQWSTWMSVTGDWSHGRHEFVFFPDFRPATLVNDRYGFRLPARLIAAELKQPWRRAGRRLFFRLACTADQQTRHDQQR